MRVLDFTCAGSADPTPIDGNATLATGHGSVGWCPLLALARLLARQTARDLFNADPVGDVGQDGVVDLEGSCAIQALARGDRSLRLVI
jgi:hypothetical protein